MISKFLNDIFTERDSKSFCPVRFCVIIGFVIYNFITIRHSWLCTQFDPVQYATGLSIIIGVVSAGMTLKYTRE